ncbi:MAG: hypothetical protein ACR2LJ_14485 [Acidimicrobiales bacterium]
MDPGPASDDHRKPRDDRVLAPTRWVSIGIVPVLCAAFVILYLFPDRTTQLWAWTIHPTMTAMMMGGGYLAGAWFFARAATASQGHKVLEGLLGTTVFTSLLLGATLLHWDTFNHGHVSFWAWLLLYVATPLLLPWLWFNNRRTDPATPAGDVAVPGAVRAVVTAIGTAQLVFALVMFVDPGLVIPHWPWAVKPLSARVIAAFIAFPAVTWALFATDRRWSSFEIPMETATIGLVLVLVATIRASAEFHGAAPAYGAVLVVTIASLVALQVAMRRRVPG